MQSFIKDQNLEDYGDMNFIKTLELKAMESMKDFL